IRFPSVHRSPVWHFGPEVCKELGSGIDEIVPPPVRGRRRKPRLQVQEGKGAWSKITGVMFQVLDLHSKAPYVCVTHPESPASWVPLKALSPDTLDWWMSEREKKFPSINFEIDGLPLRITGEPVRLIWDESN